MGTRKFRVEFEGEALIELDDAVIEAVDDEWRNAFYSLRGATEIAENIAHSLVIDKLSLSDLDGWANLPDEMAFILDDPDWFVLAAEEIK